MGFPGSSDSKESAYSAGEEGEEEGGGGGGGGEGEEEEEEEEDRRRQWHPILVLLPGKSHGRRSLVGCSPWCC